MKYTEEEREQFMAKLHEKLENRQQLLDTSERVVLCTSSIKDWEERVAMARDKIRRFDSTLKNALSNGGTKVEVYVRKWNEKDDKRTLLYEYTMDSIDDFMDLIEDRLYKELAKCLICMEETIDEINELATKKWN